MTSERILITALIAMAVMVAVAAAVNYLGRLS